MLSHSVGPTLCDPMNYSPPGSSIHGLFQARILEWIAISFSLIKFWLFVILLHNIVYACPMVTENIVTDGHFTNSHTPIVWIGTGGEDYRMMVVIVSHSAVYGNVDKQFHIKLNYRS